DFIVISLRENGSEEIYIHPNGPRGERVRLPENEHTLSLSGDIEYVSKKIRFTYQSFLTPRTVYDYDVFSKRSITRKRQSVPRWKAAGYVSKRIWVKSGNVKVPVTMVHRKGLALNGTAPLLLEAYGAYGICTDPYFSISKLSLLERGWICALAHPRGGGEMGWKWHEDAKLRTKHRTYKDVIAVADHLVAKRFTSRETLALLGGSAGGMMVGAVLNLRPDLVNAAVAYVPAADLLTSSFDESLGGTRLHYDETGDPRKPDIYRYLKKYSPYEGVRPAEYPTLLVRANLNDIRTPYWEAAKWVARLRDRKRGDSRVLFKTEMVAGHFGKSGRYEWIKDRAYDFAFLIRSLATRKRR
ncbi:MAG: prolyl oligopeptidase family serine peptidase, partial [Candidatus Paceibacterota bacterium]